MTHQIESMLQKLSELRDEMKCLNLALSAQQWQALKDALGSLDSLSDAMYLEHRLQLMLMPPPSTVEFKMWATGFWVTSWPTPPTPTS